MMGQTLSKGIKVIRVQNAAAAGTTNLVGTTVDTLGFDACLFVYGVGALTATQQTKLKCGMGILANGSDASDIQNSGTPLGSFIPDTGSNGVLVLDIYRPAPGPSKSAVSTLQGSTSPTGGGLIPNRYLTPTLVRGTANAVVDFGIAILYNKEKSPTASAEQDASLLALTLAVSQPQGVAG